MSARTSEPKCDRCQTPMERYAVPGTGGKEQAWRLACPCQHSATPDVARTSKKVSLEAACAMTALLALDDIEAGRIESAKKMLSYLVDERFGQMEEMRAEVKRRLARPSDETSDDLLYRIHRELARGHSSAALAVLAAALEHRALPTCTACDVVTLNRNTKKAAE